MPGTFTTSPMRVAPPSPGPPQTSPVRDNIVEIMSEVKSNMCSSTEKNRGVRRLEGGAVVAIAVMLVRAGTGADGLGDHADICDAGNAQFVYDFGKRAKRHGPVAAQKHGVVLRVFQPRRDSFAKLVHVDRLISQINRLSLVNGDYQPVLRHLFDRSRLLQGPFNTGLQDGPTC